MALDGKSLVYFFRRWSTDHDKDMVNYRLIKETIIEIINQFRTPNMSEINPESRFMQRSETVSDLTSTNLNMIKIGAGMSARKNNINHELNKPLKASASVINMEYMKNGGVRPLDSMSTVGAGDGVDVSKLPKLNRYNVRALNDSHASGFLMSPKNLISPDRRSNVNNTLNHSVSQASFYQKRSQAGLTPLSVKRNMQGSEHGSSFSTVGKFRERHHAKNQKNMVSVVESGKKILE